MTFTAKTLQKHLLRWYDQHGRKHLPWQQNKTPYRVFISEIMLQQTQVATVVPYFERFMQHFPDVKTLARAHEDDVLHLWAGLGYYSRARNLHKAAKLICDEFQGEFPNTLETMQCLPGVGRSTAGAILALAFNQRAVILDGNVKRVLARLHAIRTPMNEAKTEGILWTLAEKYTPTERIADYTQVMMDLGATLCTRSKPRCSDCPLAKKCLANALGCADTIPVKKATKALPVRTATFLIIKKGRAVLLLKRPSKGIWGGLWSLPEIANQQDTKALRAYCRDQFQTKTPRFKPLPAFRHTFSHYHLDIFPVIVETEVCAIMEASQQIWYNLSRPKNLGLPKPIQTIIAGLA